MAGQSMRVVGRKSPEFFGRGHAVKSRHGTVKRPLRFHLFDCSVEDIDVHVVLSARNDIETSAAISRSAIYLARELPQRVSLPRGLWKVSDCRPEARVPKMCLPEN